MTLLDERKQVIADLVKVKANGLLSMKSVAILDSAIAALSQPAGRELTDEEISDAFGRDTSDPTEIEFESWIRGIRAVIAADRKARAGK